MTRLIFIGFVSVDAAALALWLLLGLAAAQPSRAPVLSVLLFYALPALALAGVVMLYLRAPGPAARLVAVMLAGLPVLLLAAGVLFSRGVAWWKGESFDGWAQPDRAAQQRVESAIAIGDAAAVARIAGNPRTPINQGAALVAALKRLEQHPTDLAPLQALLHSGGGADAGGADVAPLAAAIRVSRRAGIAPVRLLLDAGADPNASRGMQPSWFEALATGVPGAVLEELLRRGADLRAVDMAGNGALYWAVFHRNWAATAVLIERGMDWRTSRLPGDGESLPHRVAAERRRHPEDAALERLSRVDWRR